MAEELASNALTTLETVKNELGILAADLTSDDKLKRYINEASDFVEDYTGRTFGLTEGKSELMSGSSDSYLIVRNRPINVINSIEQYGAEITDYVEDEDDYERGMIYRENGWVKSTYTTGLAEDPIGARRNITVNYDFGYVLPKDATEAVPRTLPRTLEAIAIRLTTLKFKENERDSYGLDLLKQGRLTYRFSKDTLLTSEISALNKYKQMGIY